MVPGMQHCGGGPGPNSFGQASVPLGDAQHDIGAALERWVTQGIAPDSIVATKYKTGTNPASAWPVRVRCAHIPRWRIGRGRAAPMTR